MKPSGMLKSMLSYASLISDLEMRYHFVLIVVYIGCCYASTPKYRPAVVAGVLEPPPPQPSAFHGDRGSKLVAMLRRKAEAGSIDAAADLGTLYKNGWAGLPLDHAASAQLYLKAAEVGNPIAQLNLGVYFSMGLGVPKDHDKAPPLE